MKKKLFLALLGVMLLSSCDSFHVSFIGASNSQTDTSINDTTTSIDTTTSQEVTTSSTSENNIPNGEINIDEYDYYMLTKDEIEASFTTNSFKYKGLDDVGLNSEGSLIRSSTSNAYRVGSNVLEGKVTITFSKAILTKSIVFLASSTGTSYNQTINYNENDSFVLEISQNPYTIYNFQDTVAINQLRFSCIGKGKSMLFKGILIKKGEPVHVTSIEKKSDIEVEVNRFVDVSSCFEVLPKNATDKSVKITSDDKEVVIESNKVKGTSVGEHQITVTTNDGNHSVDLTLNCTEVPLLNGYRKINKSRFVYDDIYKANRSLGITPSKGNVKVLVVPVNFSDLITVYDFRNKSNLNKLKGAFSGTKEDYTNEYAESLKSFYLKSSYGELNFDFVFTDVFTPSFTSTTFVNRADDYGTETSYLIEEFYANGTIDKQKINFSDPIYDSNNDGYVDGVWFIYNDDRINQRTNYWPYTYWYQKNSNINISVYANCSVYFTYEGTNLGYDAHTLCHETGHMLGLDDYYITTGGGNTMSPLGGLDMMDYNIGDHNAFSKFSLGWAKPYVVEEDSLITIKPFESSGECIIIPTNSFNESAFSEYIILEYYTPTGLNELDSKVAYQGLEKYFTIPGIRMFHVDARLCKANNYNSFEYLDKDVTNLTYNYSYYYEVSSSNTPSTSYSGFNLIEALTKDNRSTKGGKATNNNSLFVDGDIMDPSKYTSFFKNSLMHDNSKFEFKIEIMYTQSDGACIKITK